jgi:hypothetical protein
MRSADILKNNAEAICEAAKRVHPASPRIFGGEDGAGDTIAIAVRRSARPARLDLNVPQFDLQQVFDDVKPELATAEGLRESMHARVLVEVFRHGC